MTNLQSGQSDVVVGDMSEREGSERRGAGKRAEPGYQAEQVFHDFVILPAAVSRPIPNIALSAPGPRSPFPRRVSSACAARHKSGPRSARRRSAEKTR